MHPFAKKMAAARAAAAKRRAAAGRRRNPELLQLLNPSKKRRKRRGSSTSSKRNPVRIEAAEPSDFAELSTARAATRYAQERANQLGQVVKVWRDGRAYHLTTGARSRHAGVHYATATPDVPRGGAGLRRANPSSAAMAAALRAYREFHGVEPQKQRQVAGSAPVLVALGQLREVVYQPTRGDRKGPAFFHRFGRGAWLAATPDGKSLVLVPAAGKPFRVKWDRGIVG